MFNFGFLELMTLAVIGLIVLGPEQFPKVARGLLRVINEIKRAFSEAKMDFDDIKGETAGMLKKAEEEFLATGKPFEDLKEDMSSLMNRQEGSAKGEKTHSSTADQGAEPSEGPQKPVSAGPYQPELPEKSLDKGELLSTHQTKDSPHGEGTAGDAVDGGAEVGALSKPSPLPDVAVDGGAEDCKGSESTGSSSPGMPSENPPDTKKENSVSSVNHPVPAKPRGKRENKDE